jgi:peptidoglycan hydrolase-like protein with peptidoglycan-binding domain
VFVHRFHPPAIRRGVAGFAVALVAAAVAMAAPSASASTPIPPAPAALRTIEPLAAYVPANSCDPRAKTGTTALGSLLTKTYPGTIYYTVRPCDASVSEHYQGRAVDWMVSVKNAAQYADANAVLKWLFATDSYGNTYANVRRLGVMYIVFNNRIWGSWDRTWEPYQNCAKEPSSAYDNDCHRTHIHFSLSWEGANKRTSYWTNKPVPTDYGSCKAPDLNWAGLHAVPRATPCPTHPTLTAPAGASTLYKQVVAYSGARAVLGDTGPVVVAVQRVVGVSADGDFGPKTLAALKTWQTKHHVPASGYADQVTWRTIMSVV